MGIFKLDFKQHIMIPDGTHAKIFFENGYGASVITGSTAYSNIQKPYELAVLRGDAENWSIVYDTPITDDIIGYLSMGNVERLLDQIAELPPYEPALEED